jgi:dienelactone hydrolase
MQRPLGIIMLSDLFGRSNSFDGHVVRLAEEFGAVSVVDLFIEPPPSFHWMYHGPEREQKLREHRASIGVEAVIGRIRGTAGDLQRRFGCTQIALVGFGYGGTIALHAAQQLPLGDIDGVVAWYPDLVQREGQAAPPDLTVGSCPVQLFYGGADHQTIGSPAVAEAAQERRPNLRLRLYPAAPHGFADRTIQGPYPNPVYSGRFATEAGFAAAASWLHARTWLHVLADPETVPFTSTEH